MARDAAPAALVDALRRAPGATAAELARDLGVHHSTARYHLARLELRGVVVLLRHRGRIHAFPAGSPAPERVRLVLARSPTAGLVLARVAAQPQRLAAIARGLPFSKAAAVWHLEGLAALGLVVIEGPPRGRTYRLPGAVQGPGPGLKPGPERG